MAKDKKTLPTAFGIPVVDDQNSLTAGERGLFSLRSRGRGYRETSRVIRGAMAYIRKFWFVLVLVNVPLALAHTSLFFEDFTQGNVQLNWQSFPGFSPTRVVAISSKHAPDGDGWVGRISNGQFGGFAALSYAGRPDLDDYSVQAHVFATVTVEGEGPLNGIAIRVDPDKGRFYRLATHFFGEAKVTLAYVGRDTNNYPIYLKSWPASILPGGVPRQSGWNKMKLSVSGDSIWAYWNDHELPGCPIRDSRIAQGYFGVYANFVGARQIAETLVDDLRVENAKE